MRMGNNRGKPRGNQLRRDCRRTRNSFQPYTRRERAARDCLAGLHLADLIGGKVVGGNEASSDRMSRSPSGGCVGEFRLEGFQTIIGEQPFVERLETLESLIDRVFPQGVNSSMDWRVKKLKEFIDKTGGKVHGNLGDVCKELELSLSDRQARRLFKESAGISIKEYARKRRLVFAAKQLQDTDEPIKVIATDAGYHTHQAFKKSFSDMFCISPKEFRRMWHRTQVTT